MARVKPQPVSRGPEEAAAESGREMIRVTVRSTGFRRYRAGLGPLTREPVTVTVTPEQLASLRADTLLIVEDA